jgi:histidine triad (HIT) family protein
MECIFCKIIHEQLPSRKIWENKDFIAFFPLKHINSGHVLLIPKKHTDYVFDLDSSTYTELWNNARALSGPIQKATGARRIGMAIEGFTVSHAHLHIVPVNSGSELDPNRAKIISDEEADLLQQSIRSLIDF